MRVPLKLQFLKKGYKWTRLKIFFNCGLQHCMEWSRLPILHIRIYQSASAGIKNPFEEPYHSWMEQCHQYSAHRKVFTIKYTVTYSHYILKYELSDSHVKLQIIYTPLQGVCVYTRWSYCNWFSLFPHYLNIFQTKTNSSVLTELHLTLGEGSWCL